MNKVQAQVFKSILDDEKIPNYIKADGSAGIRPELAMHGVDIYVTETNLYKAKMLLEDFEKPI